MDNETTTAAPFAAWTPFVTPLYPGDHVVLDERGDER